MSTPQDELTILENGDRAAALTIAAADSAGRSCAGVERGSSHTCGIWRLSVSALWRPVRDNSPASSRGWPMMCGLCTGTIRFPARIRWPKLRRKRRRLPVRRVSFGRCTILLFDHQTALSDKVSDGYAEQLALDLDRFRKDLKDRTFERACAKILNAVWPMVFTGRRDCL